jgi:hypothetical protein
MTRTSLLTVLLVVLLACSVAATSQVMAQAATQRVDFSLALGEAVTLGSYTLQYQGLAGRYPAYDLYDGTSLVAHFPPTPPSPNVNRYVYQNVSIMTSGVAGDGSIVTGTLTIQ